MAGKNKKSSKPVKKTIKKKKKNKKIKIHSKSSINTSKNDVPKGVSIITVTNKIIYINNIFENYNRQTYEPKELIIILNKNDLDTSLWKEKAKNHSNVRIFKLDENITLGYCLNYGVEKSSYEIIAKFDDDDYYGPNYLSNSIKAFEYSNADVIGKRSHLVYFENSNTLAIRNPNHEHCYDSFVNGSTLIFKKKIFEKVKFPNVSIAEDTQFCKACLKKEIKIYSTDRFDHVYIRHSSKTNHTWKIDDEKFLQKSCEILKKTNDYIKYADYQKPD